MYFHDLCALLSAASQHFPHSSTHRITISFGKLLFDFQLGRPNPDSGHGLTECSSIYLSTLATLVQLGSRRRPHLTIHLILWWGCPFRNVPQIRQPVRALMARMCTLFTHTHMHDQNPSWCCHVGWSSLINLLKVNQATLCPWHCIFVHEAMPKSWIRASYQDTWIQRTCMHACMHAWKRSMSPNKPANMIMLE